MHAMPRPLAADDSAGWPDDCGIAGYGMYHRHRRAILIATQDLPDPADTGSAETA
jgi:hypothetical protein